MKLSNGSGTSARRRGWVHAALLVCTALLFACGDDFSPTAPSPEPGLEVNVLPTVSIPEAQVGWPDALAPGRQQMQTGH